MLRTRSLAVLLLALPFLTPASNAAKEAPMATCDAAWQLRYGVQTTQVLHAKVRDPKAVATELRAVLEQQGAIITHRSERNDVFDLHASSGSPLELTAKIQAHDPVWDREQETRRPQNVSLQCDQLAAARRIAKRLEGWMTEEVTPYEKQLLVGMYQNHLAQVTRLDGQLRNMELNRTPHTIQIRLMRK